MISMHVIFLQCMNATFLVAPVFLWGNLAKQYYMLLLIYFCAAKLNCSGNLNFKGDFLYDQHDSMMMFMTDACINDVTSGFRLQFPQIFILYNTSIWIVFGKCAGYCYEYFYMHYIFQQ